MKFTWLLNGLIAAAVSLTSVTGGNLYAAPSKPLTVFFPDDGHSPYSNSAASYVQLTFAQAVFGQLIHVTSGFNLEPGLLQRYYWDFNENCYVLQLAPSLKFHNGRAVTADDLVFSLTRPLLIKDLTWEQTLLLNVRGAAKVRRGEPYRPGMLEGVKKVDDRTVKVFLTASNPAFLFSLTRSSVSLMPKEELRPDLISWKALPVGAGRYQVTSEEQQGSLVHLSAVDSGTDNPRVDLMTKGDIKNADVLLGVASNPDQMLFSTVVNDTPIGVSVLQFNAQTELGRNQNFRDALKYGINRKLLVRNDLEKVATFEILPRSHWGRANTGDPFDLAKAKACLSKVPRKLLAQEIVMPAYAATQTDYRETPIGKLEAQIQAIGIPIRFDFTGKIEKVRGAHPSPILGTGLAVDYIDPLIVFSFFLKSGQFGSNMPADPSFEALYRRATMAPSFDVRVATVRDLSQHFLEETYVLPLWERQTVYHYSKKNVSSIGDQRGGSTLYLERIKMKKGSDL